MLPLGIDLGASRVRLAAAEKTRSGDVRICAVASRDLPSAEAGLQMHLVAAVVDEIRRELGVREKRCVGSLGTPNAEMRVVRFPKMSWTERRQAARFEAQRFATWDLSQEKNAVRVHPRDRELESYGVGIVRPEAMRKLVETCGTARLSLVAVDLDACALRRAFPLQDAILDLGLERSTLHTYGADGPMSYPIAAGGAMVTKGIAADLSIDITSAERRKRILGCAGAGYAALEGLVNALAEGVALARGRAEINRIALVGNGARLPGLARSLEASANAAVEIPVSELLDSHAYPDDVLRAAAPDWTLATALATWATA